MENIKQKMKETFLLEFAKKYIWWDKPEETVQYPHKIILKVMDMGTFEDTQLLLESFEKDVLIKILQNTEIGSLCLKSWYCWHLTLKICDYKDIPLLPSKE